MNPTDPAAEAAAMLIEDLEPVRALRSGPMDCGVAVFIDDVPRILVDPSGSLFLRAGTGPGKMLDAEGWRAHDTIPFWLIPERVIEDRDRLLRVVRKAVGGT